MRSTDHESYRQQQEMEESLRMDAHRIFTYLERHISPKDIDTVKYLMGIDEPTRKIQWSEILDYGK